MDARSATRSLLLALGAIVVATTGGVETAREIAAVGLRDRARSLVEGDDAKIERALEGDAPIYFALRDRVAPPAVVSLYVKNWAGDPDANVLRRVVVRQFQLRTLLFPTMVVTAFGNVGDAGAYLGAIPPDSYLVNLTPAFEPPARERFEPVAAGEGFAVFRFKGAPSDGEGDRR